MKIAQTVEEESMNELYLKVLDLQAKSHEEWFIKEQTKISEPYKKLENDILQLQEQIEQLKAQQTMLLASDTGLQEKLKEAEKDLFVWMQKMKKEQVGFAKMKYAHKSEVNRNKLLQEIDGDLDLYLTLSNVTQTALKDFVKSSGQKQLLNCIETTSTPVGLEFTL